jgi:hypothetical protein
LCVASALHGATRVAETSGKSADGSVSRRSRLMKNAQGRSRGSGLHDS